MTDLSALAGELDALVRDGRRIRLGDRNFERPHAELDALLGRLQRLADRTRVGMVGLAVANDERTVLPAAVVRGRGQILLSVARRRR